MKSGVKTRSNEVDAIHHANAVYWASVDQSPEGKAEYQRRQQRLEEIRAELLLLHFATARNPLTNRQ